MSVYSILKTNEAVAAAAETVLQLIAPSNARVKILEWGISFNGVTASEAPVDVDLLRQTTAGTGGASYTPVKFDPDDGAARSTAAAGGFTAEPTASDVLCTYQVTPNGGLFVIQYPMGREPIVVNSGRIGLRSTAANAQTCSAYMIFEE